MRLLHHKCFHSTGISSSRSDSASGRTLLCAPPGLPFSRMPEYNMLCQASFLHEAYEGLRNISVQSFSIPPTHFPPLPKFPVMFYLTPLFQKYYTILSHFLTIDSIGQYIHKMIQYRRIKRKIVSENIKKITRKGDFHVH